MAMTDERETKVQVKSLNKSFGDSLVLDNISFEMKKGEFLCVIGPTGCGKTTFLKLLSYLIEPTEGSLLIDEEPADPRHRDLAFVFQEPSPFPWLTVRGSIAFGLEIKKLPKREISRQVDNIINLMGLQKFQDSYPHQLSVNSEQRMVIGRSFAMEPDLLLTDEPYGRMDIKMRFYLKDEVIWLWEEMETTVVFITYNIEEAVYLMGRVLVLTSKPVTTKEEVHIDLPHPRNIADPEFVQLRKHTAEQIE